MRKGEKCGFTRKKPICIVIYFSERFRTRKVPKTRPHLRGGGKNSTDSAKYQIRLPGSQELSSQTILNGHPKSLKTGFSFPVVHFSTCSGSVSTPLKLLGTSSVAS